MEIIYRANDGIEFDNEVDCVHHELQLEIEMYNEYGERTTNVDFAMIVHLRTVEQACIFRDMNREHNIEPEGINGFDTGWFYWDEDHYSWIDSDVIKIFRNIPFEEDK